MAETDPDQARAVSDLRRTGILPLGLLPWGSHISIFYESTEDLVDAHADYFGAGLADHEYCLWALSDPIDRDRAVAHLRQVIIGFDDYWAAGAIDFVSGDEWYLPDDELDPQRITLAWHRRLDEALAQGFAGMRISGNAFWLQSDRWGTFLEYEKEIDRSLTGARMIALCTYPLRDANAADLLDVTRVHHVSVARREGKWEILESSQLAAVRRGNGGQDEALDILSRPFPGRELLTPRERATLAQIVRGASNKEAARTLGISPRTVEFHRTNILRKLEVRNVVELVGIVLGSA